jgi:predicted TIM-barrel fold metal-dependent hydrolase
LIERLDGSLAGRSTYKPSEYLKRLWYDTVNKALRRCARDAFGADRLLLGTDFPHWRPKILAVRELYRAIRAGAGRKKRVLDRNVQSLLGLAER